ncbi:MAG: leucyl/phenylalanyl-tRNA--protein transferase [Ruminiclostridium sp.]|nr:leucyl/phenylalanyl-tRNA--protein transferase [Ruminiclostridium sp.]
MPVFRLQSGMTGFPDPTLAEEDGLLAVGGDLSVEMLVLAYSRGIFPWFNEGDPVLWWCPHERFIIRPENIHISKSMRKFMRNHDTKIVFNRDFRDTMHRCRLKREFSVGTWITDDMERAYCELHRKGVAVSAESYIDGELAGGLYGVCLGRCFFGESMFSDMENGSKAALILLAKYLAERGGVMIDCQFRTDHLASMGGETISYGEYMELLRK